MEPGRALAFLEPVVDEDDVRKAEPLVASRVLFDPHTSLPPSGVHTGTPSVGTLWRAWRVE